MKRLKNPLILGITLYYLIPLSVMAVTPEEVAANPVSYTGQYVKKYLE